ncbi:hypothetical protein DPMN_118855 [Dreissena polymorpha]|uniref:Uncharacterized protein n=1 Tax=Dreissena polymorpha TaxID=45954 RepID=A0A9D4GNV3_DREPO|nr:hypothetical protein DPMN_118855 [Dreissena polymorpha]
MTQEDLDIKILPDQVTVLYDVNPLDTDADAIDFPALLYVAPARLKTVIHVIQTVGT